MATSTNASGFPTNDCAALVISRGNSTAPLEPNSDVTGIGVIISFMISAYVVWAVATFCYLFGFLPKNLLNTYDELFLKRKSYHSKNGKGFYDALVDGVLAAADTQVLQGCAILIAAFTNVNNLTVYDWQIVVYLAWMSSNVHLTTLHFLRDYLRPKRWLRNIRLAGMVLLLCLLLVAFALTSTYNWVLAVTRIYDAQSYPPDEPDGFYALNYAMPAHCFWHRPFNGHGPLPEGFQSSINPDAPFTYLSLLIVYIWKIAELFVRDRGYNTVLDEEQRREQSDFRRAEKARGLASPLRLLARAIKRTARHTARIQNTNNGGAKVYAWSILFRVVCITYATTLALFDFFCSFVACLWVLLLLLLWGSLEVANVRNKALPGVHSILNEWSFGQILPMLLLAGPIMAVVNHFMRNHDMKQNTDWTVVKEKLHFKIPSLRFTFPRVALSKDIHLIDYFDQLGADEEPDLELLSRQYFYKSRVFKSLLILPNLMALGGGVIAFWLEGRAVAQKGSNFDHLQNNSIKDPKGWVFVYIALILAGALSVWFIWAGVCMFISGLFEHRHLRHAKAHAAQIQKDYHNSVKRRGSRRTSAVIASKEPPWV